MGWWGKLIGGACGFALGGPLGALIGAVLGHHLDTRIRLWSETGQAHHAKVQERMQAAFFTATFSVLGHVAKVDGRVSEREIMAAEQTMTQLGFTGEQRKAAIRLFYQGKRPDFPLDEILEQLLWECRGRLDLIQMFIEAQLRAAYADGTPNHSERRLLMYICHRLGIPRRDFERLEALTQANRSHHYYQRSAASMHSTKDADAYATLGVERTASDEEVKRAYRRLMSQNHPDKLMAKALPEEMIKVATEKTQVVKEAYEQIRNARGFK